MTTETLPQQAQKRNTSQQNSIKEQTRKEVGEIIKEEQIKKRTDKFAKAIGYEYKQQLEGSSLGLSLGYTGGGTYVKEDVCMTFDQKQITELLKKYDDTQMGKLLTITKKLYKKKIKQQTKEYINPNQSIDDMPQDPNHLLNEIIKSYTSPDMINFDKITYRDLAKWEVIIDHSNEDTIDLNTLINSGEVLYQEIIDSLTNLEKIKIKIASNRLI